MMAAFFLGLWLVFILIILGIEFYYYILNRYFEKELTGIEAIIFFICLIVSIILFMKSFSQDSIILFGLLSTLPVPAADFIIKSIVKSKEKAVEKIEKEKNIKNWLYTIEKQPDNVNAYVELGNIYFNDKNYEKAMEFYKKAQQVMDLPYIREKIKITEKELLIQKGIVWVCPECSFDNPGTSEKCKFCGYTKIDANILRELKSNKQYLLKGIFWILIGPLIVIFFFALYLIMPVYLALIITILAIYFVIKYFLTY